MVIRTLGLLLTEWWEKQPLKNDNEMLLLRVQFSSVQLLSRIRLFATPWIAARQASLSITSYHNTLKEQPFDCVLPKNHVFLKRRVIQPAEVQGRESRSELQPAQICNISYTPTSPLALMVASSIQAKMLVTWSLTAWESKAQDRNSCSISTDSPYLHRKHTPTGKWGPLK